MAQPRGAYALGQTLKLIWVGVVNTFKFDLTDKSNDNRLHLDSTAAEQRPVAQMNKVVSMIDNDLIEALRHCTLPVFYKSLLDELLYQRLNKVLSLNRQRRHLHIHRK